jgi:HSP20 family molecular chaperone IbpA
MKITKETKLAPTAIERPLVRDPFFERIRDFENAMMRQVYELFGPLAGFGNIFASSQDPAPPMPVPIELRETDEGLLLYAELPGFKEEEIELRVEPWRVYLTGKHEKTVERERKGKPVYAERTWNEFTRGLELPCEINPNKVKATLSKGVLEIAFEKVLPAKKVPIEVKAA